MLISNYSWFNLGETQRYFYKAKDLDELKEFLVEVKKKKLKITVLGAGSNTLFRDSGVKGVVLKLGRNFSYTKIINNNIIEAGAATLDRKVAIFAKDNKLGNLEFLSCIPGSIGGAIMMNSGCYGYDISKVLISLKAINKNSLSETEIKKDDIKFLYRGTNLSKDLIILSANLKENLKKRWNRKCQFTLSKGKEFSPK